MLLNFKVYICYYSFFTIFIKKYLILKDCQYTQGNIRKVEIELFNKAHNTIFDLKKTKNCMCHDYKRRKRRILCKIWDSQK